MALKILAEAGSAVAQTQLLEGSRRAYLESTRFDRMGARGRRHVVALDVVHAAFVAGPRRHWVSTCEQLYAQKRLAKADLDQV